MLKLKEILSSIKESDNYGQNAALLTVLLNSFSNKPVIKSDLAEIKVFTLAEMNKLIALIKKTTDYKLKDELFNYEDKLIGLFMLLLGKNYEINDDEMMIMHKLVDIVAKEQVLENTIHEIFEHNLINQFDIAKIIDIVKGRKDEFHRGMLYPALLHHKDNMDKLTSEAKIELAKYFISEFERYLSKKKLNDVEINNLEIAVDVCAYFATDRIIELLKDILKLGYNNINYYVVDSLLAINQHIDIKTISELAKDIRHASVTYALLERNKQADLFPKEFAAPEYLAKSDMVQWLVYPTELGKMPCSIELLGTIDVKKELYHIFKYKSDSDNLEDSLKNEWLIGWSSNDESTFSNFDKLSQFEQKNNDKTLKVIKKKLFG